MYSKDLLSEDIKTVTEALKQIIENDQKSDRKRKMIEGADYYNYKHSILDYKLFYTDKDGFIKEEKNRSNVKIPHPFFTELVDQKVHYLLSNPIDLIVEDEALKENIKEYFNEKLQVLIKDLVEGASCKGDEFIYTFINEDNKLTFKIADSVKVVEVYDDDGNRTHVIRYYNKAVKEDKTIKEITCAEIWDTEKVSFYVKNKNGSYELDDDKQVNPKPHVLAKNDKGELAGKGLGYIPFFKLSNNKRSTTDLEPIKLIIDDYDLMSCSLSNNLIDFDHPIYAVRGYPGENLDTLVNNLKTRKTVGVGENGGVDVKTVNIPVEARKAKLELDKEGIYKFGMGFDSSQVGDGNLTNIVIKARYMLLELKCNKIETRLREVLREMIRLIVDDINAKNGTAYNYQDVEISIVKQTMVNDQDEAEKAKTIAETKSIIINAILATAPILDNDSVIELICDEFELDFEEVKQKIEEQEYTQGLSNNTDEDDEEIEE